MCWKFFYISYEYNSLQNDCKCDKKLLQNNTSLLVLYSLERKAGSIVYISQPH